MNDPKKLITTMQQCGFFAVLTQRPEKDTRRSFLQDRMMQFFPFFIYGFDPLLAVVFLYNSKSNQFIFSLLPVTAQENRMLIFLAATYEFHVILLWMAVAHFWVYHCLTFTRVIERELINQETSVAKYFWLLFS